MCAPLPLVTTFKAGTHYIYGSFSSVEFTQLLEAGLGAMVGLNPNVVTQLRQRTSMHKAIKEMPSTQHKQKFTALTKCSYLFVWMDLTMILPSPNIGVDSINQENSAM